MTGIIGRILRARFGEPRVVLSGSLTEYRWNEHIEALRCVLYKETAPTVAVEDDYSILRGVYGDCVGGSLLRGALKVAMLRTPSVFGLYQYQELQVHPSIRIANLRDPDIHFFMDSSNVWYYGLKEDQLFVYDAETDELNALGGIASAIDGLLTEWLQVKSTCLP